MTACALNGSRTIFIAKSTFFAFSPVDFNEVPEDTIQTLKPSRNGPEVNIRIYSSAPSDSQVDTTLIMDKGIKKSDVFAINAPKRTLPGVSLKFAAKDAFYTLGDCVTITSSSSISEHMHIDSVSYRVSYYLHIICNLRCLLHNLGRWVHLICLQSCRSPLIYVSQIKNSSSVLCLVMCHFCDQIAMCVLQNCLSHYVTFACLIYSCLDM